MNKYQVKYKQLQRRIKDIVFENAALIDQISQVQNDIVSIKDERRFLMQKLIDYEPELVTEINVQRPTKRRLSDKSKKASAADGPPLARKPKNEVVAIKSEPLDAMVEEPLEAHIKLEPPADVVATETRPPAPPASASGGGGGGGNLVVQNMGEIAPNRPAYHNEHWIYPIGYTSVRIFGSMKDPYKKSVYTCRIVDGGDCPRFEMTSAADPDLLIVGPSPEFCHSTLLQFIRETYEFQNFNIQSNGDWFFGLAHPAVMNLIENLPNAKLCTNFKGFLKSNVAVAERENDPGINFEAFQNYITNVCSTNVT